MAIEMMSEERISPAAAGNALHGGGGGLALSHSGTYGAEGDGNGGGNSNDGGISHGSVSPYKNILYFLLLRDAPLFGGLLQINGNERRENDGLQRAEEQRMDA